MISKIHVIILKYLQSTEYKSTSDNLMTCILYISWLKNKVGRNSSRWEIYIWQ